jgi:hypothetical protein
MRTTIVLLAIAAIVVAVLAACSARDDSVADSAAGDNARADEPQSDSVAAADDSAPAAQSTPRDPRTRTPAIQRVEDSIRDSILPPEDSIRAMRPKLPQVVPEKRPRAWRGFKLPEERPVRIPLEQAPDSTMKGDSTKPPKPPR